MSNKSRMCCKITPSNNKVTGSCLNVIVTLPNKKEVNFLVDCGKFQGRNEDNLNDNFLFDPRNIDFVLVTHNHLDHIGRLPQLIKNGYSKKICTTNLTKYLLVPALDDAFKVEENNSHHLKREMLFNREDINSVIRNTKGFKYKKKYKVNHNINVTFFENGHLPGAAYILCEIFYEGFDSIYLLFCGDYKKDNMLYFVEDVPEEIRDLPLTIIQECTYGNSDSFERKNYIKNNIIKAIKNKGTVVIPSFAQGRFDEVTYLLRNMQKSGELSLDVLIGLDGKLPKRYWNIRKEHPDLYNYISDVRPFNAINLDKTSRIPFMNLEYPKIIVTTSGMGTYGPAPTYIKHFLSHPNALIQFAGYTAEDSLGRRLIDADYGSLVNVFGDDIIKNARIECTKELTAHAYRDELVEFLNKFNNIKALFITHGEPDVKAKYKNYVLKNTKIFKEDIKILNRNKSYFVSSKGIIY